MARFTYTPSYEPTEASKPRVRKNETSNGFAQRGVYGINADLKTWELVFSNITALERESIAAFLDSHSGSGSFEWIPPGGTVGNYVCEDWQVTLSNCLHSQIRATFREVPDIQKAELVVTQENYLPLNIEGLMDSYEPVNRDWAYYRLERNTSDDFENYANGTNVGNFLFKKYDGLTLAQFNGTTQYFVTDPVSTSRGLLGSAGTADNTVLLWFRFTALPSTVKYLWIASNAAQTIYTGLRYNNTTQKLEYVRYSQGSANVVVVSQLTIQTNTTYTTCCRYVGATGVQQLYINNTLQNSTTAASTLAITAGDDTRITAAYSLTEGYTAVNLGRFRVARQYLTDIGNMMTLPTIQIYFGSTPVSNTWIVILDATTLGFTVPTGITPGTHFVYALIGGVSSAPMQVRYIDLPVRKTPVSIRFDSSNVLYAYFDAMSKGWGGANGGVVSQNVSIGPDDTGTTVLVLESHGDNYTGSIQGVDRQGNPKYNINGTPWVTRVGAVVVSNEYYCFGRYEYEAKVIQVLGVASAFWNFHYMEIYPDDPRWDTFVNTLGLHASSDGEGGSYIVRNNEIDIELPSHLDGGNPESPSLVNGKFNTWRGELQNWAVSKTDPAYWEEYRDNYRPLGINPTDNQYHIYRYDWYHDRVEFYVDNVLIVTNVNNQFGYVSNNIPDVASKVTIGPWFPSASVKWAGTTAPFSTQKMYVKTFKYTPFTAEINAYQVYAGETYASVGAGTL